MSLYNDLTTVLTPYANKIKQNESDIGDIQDALEHLNVETDKTLSIDGKPADAKETGDKIRALETALSRNSADISSIKDDIEDLAGGIPDAQKRLIIAIMRSSLYSSDQSENINTLEDLFFANIPATSITLNQSSISLIADEQEEQTFALIATVHPVYTTDAVVWSSSNDSVATVSNTGLVAAVSSGTAIITARAGDVSAQCNVNRTGFLSQFIQNVFGSYCHHVHSHAVSG